MSMRNHISHLTSTCFCVQRQIRCLDRLQAVQNAAVSLIVGAIKFDRVTTVTSLLRERHWLPVKQRITFKMPVMTYKCVHGTTAKYLADYIRPPSSATADLHLRLTSSSRLFVPRLKTAAGDRCFAVTGPRLWNSLPTLSHQQAPWSFKKKQLKIFYLEQRDHMIDTYCWHFLLTL